MKNDKLWQLMLLLGLIVVIFGFLTRTLTKADTLYDYAQKNPEIAYAEKETEETSEESVETVVEEMTIEETTETDAEELINSETVPSDDPSSYSDTRFYYEPISPEIEARIRGISYPEDDTDLAITLDDLAYVSVLYNDFEGNVQTGELICNKAIAQDLVEIFTELYLNNYQFESIKLIDEYGGDDTVSMEHNNTSCFNYRVVDGTTNLSKHAYGLAIDINPFYNPYVVFNKDGTGETYISPKGSEVYADRDKDFPYKIDENDLCYQLFIEHGFTWGGHWNSSKDYQHFQKLNAE